MIKQERVSFLGPPGTYSYETAVSHFNPSTHEFINQKSINDVFDSVRSKEADYGVIPFENSTYGSVLQTLDYFVLNSKLSDSKGNYLNQKHHTSFLIDFIIHAEHFLNVHHCLLSISNLNDIEKVYSHPEALGQCSDWLSKHLPHAQRIPVGSTSQGAEMAAKEFGSASISSVVCADLFKLNIIAQNIENISNNTTRFFIIGSEMAKPTGHDETLVMFTLNHNQSGTLCDALAIMKKFNLNLTKIDSRPSGQNLWHYMFFMEFEGHVLDEDVKLAMNELCVVCQEVVVLGSYESKRNAS
ncbi:Prephenate dehydratase-domain-containing protein [Globomyces pollinis-pini]|nr:Prephenate dehydratase-domain-containing protein [Globomyces pollinis-pini]